jgi:hypothetical protein
MVQYGPSSITQPHFQLRYDVSNIEHSVSLTDEFSPNFDLKNMISTYIKDFSWQKMPKFADFEDM